VVSFLNPLAGLALNLGDYAQKAMTSGTSLSDDVGAFTGVLSAINLGPLNPVKGIVSMALDNYGNPSNGDNASSNSPSDGGRGGSGAPVMTATGPVTTTTTTAAAKVPNKVYNVGGVGNFIG